MEDKAYHHGNLKRALIEAGIELVNKEGESGLSLRKIAAKCSVSNAAPYAHFKSKNELLLAMKEHIIQEFLNVLQETIQKYPYNRDLLTHLGKTYVMFFYNNPHYYSFLFSQTDITVDLTPNADIEKNCPPLALFQKTAIKILKQSGLTDEKLNDVIIAMWALVHGLASIATMKNVRFYDSWENKVEEILKAL